MAFIALQLAVYTCGFDIHVHAMGAQTAPVAESACGFDVQTTQLDEPLQDKNDNHEKSHACHVHATHTFTVFDVDQLEINSVIATAQLFILGDPNLKDLQFLIEYPPKLLHS